MMCVLNQGSKSSGRYTREEKSLIVEKRCVSALSSILYSLPYGPHRSYTYTKVQKYYFVSKMDLDENLPSQ